MRPVAVLVLLLPMAFSSACQKDAACPAGSEDYNGKCLPHLTASYVRCVDAKDKNLTEKIEAGATVPAAAFTTFKAAYSRSWTEDSAAALQYVKDCMTLAREEVSGKEAAAVQEVEKKTIVYIKVVERRQPAIEVEPSALTCTENGCGQITVKSTGKGELRIGRINVTGPDSDDFRVGESCANRSLGPARGPDDVDTCTVTVGFEPSGAGERSATLVIHQNLPKPDTGTRVTLTGKGTGGTPPEDHTLTVDAGPGITVTSDPAGIDCGSECSAAFTGAEVTLTASYVRGDGGGLRAERRRHLPGRPDHRPERQREPVVACTTVVVDLEREVAMREVLGWLAWLATIAAFYPLNQWLVRRKCLDHRPWFVPSLWGPVGTAAIILARPAGWRRFPS
ncbi:hypothetical protein [Paractinoplanes atraurantiacus]|uniref:IPT/TIG domain-containing protein n=1 Tax=Paractinoplanes atraurantiacus TaxID=1036182 RepID=A0A285K7W4_9ACTN|nr:hypothetical protein [Actinoplanes atraurantiacus]SNY68694.1 hypothetical protein SAMN05421748_133119 [Actinoplanes atraurantiacus]